MSKANLRQQELAYYTAYYSGIFSQQYKEGKFPDYDKFAPKLQKKPSAQQRDWRHLKMMIEAWNATAGGFDNRVEH